MKKTKLFLLFSFISILFISCYSFQPEICEIYEYETDNCTITLDKTTAPKGSIVKVTVIPDKGYYVKEFSGTKFYPSTEEENVYFIPVAYDGQYIKPKIEKMDRYSIFKKSTNCSIETSLDSTFKEDTVTFTVKPADYYYCTSDFIKIENKYDSSKTISFTKVAEKENEYSFVMPENSVEIIVNCEVGIKALSHKTSFTEGEKIVFDIENHLGDKKFDILTYDFSSDFYITYSDYKIISEDITLTDSYELPDTNLEAGMYQFMVYPHGKRTPLVTTDFQINLENTPEGWRTLNLCTTDTSLTTKNYITLNILYDEKSPYTLKYLLENSTTSESEEKSLSLRVKTYSFSGSNYYGSKLTSSDYDNYNKISFWIEDSTQKLNSKKITLDLVKE